MTKIKMKEKNQRCGICNKPIKIGEEVYGGKWMGKWVIDCVACHESPNPSGLPKETFATRKEFTPRGRRAKAEVPKSLFEIGQKVNFTASVPKDPTDFGMGFRKIEGEGMIENIRDDGTIVVSTTTGYQWASPDNVERII